MAVYLIVYIKKLREIKFNKIQILFANLLEILSICSFFVLIINNDKDNSNLIVLFPFVFIIILSFLNITIISKLLNNTFSNLLGKASLVMYLNQVFLLEHILDILEQLHLKRIQFYLLLS